MKQTIKYLGSMIEWSQQCEVAVKDRTALAEEVCKKLTLVWNSTQAYGRKLKVFQVTRVPVLTYGLDSFTLATPQINKIDATYFIFL